MSASSDSSSGWRSPTATAPLHVVDCSGLTLPVLRELCAEHDGRHAYFLERPARHFYKPEGTAVAVFERGG